MRCLDVQQREKQIYQKERENAENAETVIAGRKKIRRKILCNVIVKSTVISRPIVKRNRFADKRQRKEKEQDHHKKYGDFMRPDKTLYSLCNQ